VVDVLSPPGYPGAVDALRRAGESVIEVELDEFLRADGEPTCLVAPVPERRPLQARQARRIV